MVKPKQWIADDVREFLLPAASDHNPELWAYFGAYDHVVLAQLWGKMISLPAGIPMYTHDLKQEMDRLGIASTAVPHNQDAHDALADARRNWAMLREIRRPRSQMELGRWRDHAGVYGSGAARDRNSCA